MNISNSVLLITVRSSRADKKFDTTVGHIEDIIMGMFYKIRIKQAYNSSTVGPKYCPQS